jgi:hypothetical protein
MPVFLFRRKGIIPEKDFGHNADYGKTFKRRIFVFMPPFWIKIVGHR